MSQFIFSSAKKYVKRLKKIIRNRKGMDFSQKNIHRFRVTMKRIRTIYRLSNNLHSVKSKPKILNALRVVYSNYGKKRDLFVQKEILRGYKSVEPIEVEAFLALLDEQEKKDEKLFFKAMKSFQKKSKTFFYRLIRKQGKDFKPVEKYDYVEFIIKKQQLINELSLGITNDDEIHDIRKHLKDIVYTLEIGMKTKKNFEIETETLNWINELQELLGVWNDYYNLEQSLIKASFSGYLFPKLKDLVTKEKENRKSIVLESLLKFRGINCIIVTK